MGRTNRAISIGVSAIIVIAVILIMGFGVYFVGVFNATNSTISATSGAAMSAYSNVSSTSKESNSTICIVNVEGAGVFLHLVSDSGKDLANISVVATPKANSCLGYPPYPQPGVQQSNSTGWVDLGAASQANYYYEISLNYSSRDYSFVLPQGPLDITLATFSLPSGNLSISLCYTLTASQSYSCHPYTSATTTVRPNATTTTSFSGS